MESLLKTLWRRLRFYLIDWGLIARRGIFYIGGSFHKDAVHGVEQAVIRRGDALFVKARCV